MALKLKVISVEYMVEETIDGQSVQRDLSAEGRIQIHAQYYNSSAPANILYEKDFVFGAKPFTAADALEDMRAQGRLVRDTRLLAGSLATYIGTEFDLDA